MKKSITCVLLFAAAAIFFGACTPKAPPENSVSSASAFPISSSPEISVSKPDASSAKSEASPASEASQTSPADQVTAPESPEASSRASVVSDSSLTTPEAIDTSIIDHFSEKPFVKKLSDEMLLPFAEMYKAVINCERSVRFQKPVHTETLDKLMLLLNYECPELIHVKGDYSTIYADEQEQMVSTVSFYYNMSPQDYKTNLEKTEAYLSTLQKTLEGKSDYEKEKAVYDMIFRQCVYDETSENAGSVYGALLEHRARCEGISKAFMWCMRRLGLECITVVGEPTWTTNALFVNHSWNLVKLGKSWYHVDLTSDNLQSDDVHNNPALYGFLNVDDSFVYQSRILSPYYREMGVPACTDTTLNYHRRSGLQLKDGEGIKEGFYRVLDNHFEQGEDNEFPVKLASVSDYDAALESWTDWLEAYQLENDLGSYSNTVYHNRVAQTICIRSIYEPSETIQSPGGV